MQKFSAPVVEQRERHGPEHVGVQLLLALKSKNDPPGLIDLWLAFRNKVQNSEVRSPGGSFFAADTRGARRVHFGGAPRAWRPGALWPRRQPASHKGVRRGARAGLFELHWARVRCCQQHARASRRDVAIIIVIMVTIAPCRVVAVRALARGAGCSARAALRQLRRATRRFSWQRARLFELHCARVRWSKQHARRVAMSRSSSW
jgi:hypothetical protein